MLEGRLQDGSLVDLVVAPGDFFPRPRLLDSAPLVSSATSEGLSASTPASIQQKLLKLSFI